MRGVQLRRVQGQPERLPVQGGVRQQLRGDGGNVQGHVSAAEVAGAVQGQAAKVVGSSKEDILLEKRGIKNEGPLFLVWTLGKFCSEQGCVYRSKYRIDTVSAIQFSESIGIGDTFFEMYRILYRYFGENPLLLSKIGTKKAKESSISMRKMIHS